MTAPPQIIERALTFKFAQSVSLTTGIPDIMEVSVLPLDDASSNSAGATFAGGLKTVKISLSLPSNVVTFDMIPSYSAGLNQPILYRVMWRAGVMARTFTYDFAMPDADIDFDALASLNFIITGETYLQQSDLGVPGRVARLNQAGEVIDAAGNPVASNSDITSVTGLISTERVARQQADTALRTTLETELNVQVASTLSTANIYTNNQITGVNSDIASERASRQGADADLQTQLNTKTGTLQSAIDSLVASTGGNTTALNTKADLDNTGHVPVAQIPDAILTNAYGAANQAAMLALSPTVVHKGSLAIRPDGVFLLTAADPTNISNWVSLTTVASVNTKRGDVVLSAADVNAIPVGGTVAQSQVTGLNTALLSKANQTDLVALSTSFSALQNDPTLVHTVSGVVPTNLLSSDMVYINSVGQLVKKDGTIIPITGGGGAVFSVNSKTGLVVLTASDVNAIPVGGAIGQGQITGLSSTLSAKADLDGSSLVPVAQIPSLPTSKITGLATALSNKADLVSNLVPLSQVPILPQSQITGLSTLITNNALTTSSNAVNRIASLEAQVASGGGGGGGGGIGSQVPYYTSSNTTTPVTSLSTQVQLHSPWGVDSDGTITGTTGTWYYLYTGVRSQDVAYPYITPNGHLNLRVWNESNASDPAYALQSDFTALTSAVVARALQTDLVSLQNTVASKANSSDLTTLSGQVDLKASIANLNATNTAVASKANASDLASLTTVVGTKAAQTGLDAANTAIAARALQTDLTTANTNITNINTALTSKADLVSGRVPVSQTSILPQSQITGLVTALSAKADLDGSNKVLLSQLPSIPQSSITGLGTSLGNKADLVGGFVPMSQIPLGAVPNVQVVANRAAMLALSVSQVQYGDLALVTGTADKGTYVLTGTDPSIFTNWTSLTTPDAPVVSVNGFTGTVVLGPSDVGALSSSASIPQSQISGLTAALATFATSSALTSGLAGKTSPSDVQNMFFASSMVKRADYVAAAPIASLAGQQSIDGVLVPNAAIVLATSQPSSVNNGLWVVNAGGNWTRPADFATGSFVSRDTIVIVSNATGAASGTTNSYTVWQMTVASGFIDSSSNNWTRIAWAAPPFAPVGGNGIAVAGSTFSVTAAPGGGLVSASGGVSVDSVTIPRKFVGTVPSGSTVAGITHNLNTTRPQVTIWDTASATMVLAGVTAVTANSISIEFANAPASGQYQVSVIG